MYGLTFLQFLNHQHRLQPFLTTNHIPNTHSHHINMPSIRYYNETAPFWDFIANLESNGAQHPFFSAYNPQARDGQHGDLPHRSHHEGPQEGEPSSSQGPQQGPSGPPDPEVPLPPQSPEDTPWGAFPFGPRGHCGPHRGGWGGRGRRGPWGRGRRWENTPFGDFDMNKIGEIIASQFGLGGDSASKEGSNGKDFSPPADVFDTEDSYIVHISLPGAKKEDVGVNWDADKSELSIAGVIYRPGSEDFLKTLALDERKVGVFERKIRLGSRVSPALVDMDGISAKMEDGVLIVTIPKEDKDFVDVKKVDIQ